MQLIGSCSVVVDAVNNQATVTWFDGTLPLGDPGDPGGLGEP